MLGEKFRELRKSQNKNINETAKDITSSSSLRRWECGEGEMSITKVVKLLNKLHITPKEFMDIADMEDDNFYEVEIGICYANNDLQGLKNFIDISKKYHLEQPSNKKYLFFNAIACNFYADLTEKNLFSDNDVLRLKSYFLSIENWTQENVLLFGNTQLLLPADDIYIISRSLYSYLMYHNKARDFYVMSINTLLNGVFCLLKMKNAETARKLLAKIETLDLPNNFTNEKIRIDFMKALFDYVNDGLSSSIEKLLASLATLGIVDMANDFKFAFNQIREVYN